eukprot:GHVL01036963.1.p1 GENE.GHVL01036963.1~~GHVL01036963.1.p1  ORF type:complete len:758 (+),score=215.16 GHVL01036963.1:632-2905(+)
MSLVLKQYFINNTYEGVFYSNLKSFFKKYAVLFQIHTSSFDCGKALQRAIDFIKFTKPNPNPHGWDTIQISESISVHAVKMIKTPFENPTIRSRPNDTCQNCHKDFLEWVTRNGGAGEISYLIVDCSLILSDVSLLSDESDDSLGGCSKKKKAAIDTLLAIAEHSPYKEEIINNICTRILQDIGPTGRYLKIDFDTPRGKECILQVDGLLSWAVSCVTVLKKYYFEIIETVIKYLYITKRHPLLCIRICELLQKCDGRELSENIKIEDILNFLEEMMRPDFPLCVRGCSISSLDRFVEFFPSSYDTTLIIMSCLSLVNTFFDADKIWTVMKLVQKIVAEEAVSGRIQLQSEHFGILLKTWEIQKKNIFLSICIIDVFRSFLVMSDISISNYIPVSTALLTACWTISKDRLDSQCVYKDIDENSYIYTDEPTTPTHRRYYINTSDESCEIFLAPLDETTCKMLLSALRVINTSSEIINIYIDLFSPSLQYTARFKKCVFPVILLEIVLEYILIYIEKYDINKKLIIDIIKIFENFDINIQGRIVNTCIFKIFQIIIIYINDIDVISILDNIIKNILYILLKNIYNNNIPINQLLLLLYSWSKTYNFKKCILETVIKTNQSINNVINNLVNHFLNIGSQIRSPRIRASTFELCLILLDINEYPPNKDTIFQLFSYIILLTNIQYKEYIFTTTDGPIPKSIRYPIYSNSNISDTEFIESVIINFGKWSKNICAKSDLMSYFNEALQSTPENIKVLIQRNQ